MPNNTINISFDLLGLQGASHITGKDGREYVAICLPESRVNAHSNGKCYLSLDVKANKDGEDKFQKTHFVAESTTKEERQGKVRLPIIGNGKEFIFDNGGRTAPQSQRPHPRQQPKTKSEESWDRVVTDEPEDSIPW